MNNTIQSISLIIIIVVLASLGLVVYGQNQKIIALESGSVVKPIVETPPPATLFADELNKANKSEQQAVLDNSKSITGEIKNIAGSVITVEAIVTNVADVGQTDFSKPHAIGLVKKTYQIDITQATAFPGKKLSQLKVGDMVQVSSDTPILNVDKFVAKEIFVVVLSL